MAAFTAKTMQIGGTKELERFLKDFPFKVRETILDASVRAGASVIRKEGRKNIRENGSIKTGKLFKSFKVVKVRGVHGVMRIMTTAPHSHLVEFGTSPRKLKEPRHVNLNGKWVLVEYTGSTPAKPFFRPAIDEHHKEVMMAIALRMGKRMSAEAEKLASRYGSLKKSYIKRIAI